MVDMYATRPEPTLSMPIRMEKKRKRTRFGILALVGAVGFVVGAAFNFQRSGSVLIAIYLSIFAAILLATGVTQLITASKMR